MNKEQIEELTKILNLMKEAVLESEAMIVDYTQCQSEVSKKYLAAAIKKHAARITSFIPNGFFD